MSQTERDQNLIKALAFINDPELDNDADCGQAETIPFKPMVSSTHLAVPGPHANQARRLFSNTSNRERSNASRQVSAQNLNFESILYKIYKNGESSKMPTQAIRLGSIERPSMLSKTNSIQKSSEPEFCPLKFADQSPDTSPKSQRLTTAFRRQNTENIFRGESFYQEEFDRVQTTETGANQIQNTILHMTGTCPTCKQPLPPDFNQFMVVESQADKPVDLLTYAPNKKMKISGSFQSVLSKATASA